MAIEDIRGVDKTQSVMRVDPESGKIIFSDESVGWHIEIRRTGSDEWERMPVVQLHIPEVIDATE